MSYFFRKLGKIRQNLSSAAVVIGALRVNLAECRQSDLSLTLLEIQKTGFLTIKPI